MNRRVAIRSVLVFVSTLLLSASAGAQLFRAYLAPDGLDTNPCTLAAPCRLLPAALTAVQDGGEIWMLDSANYNTTTVEIAKSVAILAVPGAVGSVVAAGGNAININTAGVKVALRNLVIVPLPGAGGTNGIQMAAGAGLTIEHCVLANLPGTGILAYATGTVRISDTTIRGNGNGGLYVSGTSATVTRAIISGNGLWGIQVFGYPTRLTTADIADSTLDGNSDGINVGSQVVTAPVNISVKDSRVVKNTSQGIAAQSQSGGGAITLSASNNVVSNNGGYGILSSFSGATVWASGNTVSSNLFGLVNDNAVFETAGDNAVRNNLSGDTSGTITIIAKK